MYPDYTSTPRPEKQDVNINVKEGGSHSTGSGRYRPSVSDSPVVRWVLPVAHGRVHLSSRKGREDLKELILNITHNKVRLTSVSLRLRLNLCHPYQTFQLLSYVSRKEMGSLGKERSGT